MKNRFIVRSNWVRSNWLVIWVAVACGDMAGLAFAFDYTGPRAGSHRAAFENAVLEKVVLENSVLTVGVAKVNPVWAASLVSPANDWDRDLPLLSGDGVGDAWSSPAHVIAFPVRAYVRSPGLVRDGPTRGPPSI